MTTQPPSPNSRLSASFRDPSGFLFTRQGVLYRQVNQAYQPHYDKLLNSGLYDKLVKAGLLIPHEEVGVEPAEPSLAYKVLRPERVDFISYPYEWSFSQLQDAALATMAIQKLALDAGMVLKDSSAYNIQFYRGRPVLIDTLSFEAYREGEPWVAYRQFCQHFLAPLSLMAYTDVRLNQLLRIYIDGVPLDLAVRLLPGRTRFDLGLATHIHLHAVAQQRYADKAVPVGQTAEKKPAARAGMSKLSFQGLMDSLESTTRKLKWKAAGTEWGDYYAASAGHYSSGAFEHKHQLVGQFLERIQPQRVWDLGANTGEFSRLASERSIPTVAFDIDPAAVEQNYQACKTNKETHMLPLVMDLTNPSPGLGWHNRERQSLAERGPVDAVLALALIHHLAISNNVPLPQLAETFHSLCTWLVIEFVPKEDSQVKKLLATRQDIFTNYHLPGFEAAFEPFFTIHEKVQVQDSPRTLYLLEAKA
ncbi:MAG TPA: class I SAM-dependent methyltransferase [Anaerolineales bacterium]|nr:class I SAM-dependent methyltransferase [Anaerolineales bacterium]